MAVLAERLRRPHHLIEGRREEAGLPSRVTLRHKVRREDGQTRSAANGNLRPVLVGQRDPGETQTLGKKMAEREANQVDSGIGIGGVVSEKRCPEAVQTLSGEVPTEHPIRLGHVVGNPLLLSIVQRLNPLVNLLRLVGAPAESHRDEIVGNDVVVRPEGFAMRQRSRVTPEAKARDPVTSR